MLVEIGWPMIPVSGCLHLFTHEILVLYPILSLLENEVMTLRLGRPRLCCRLSEILGWMFGRFPNLESRCVVKHINKCEVLSYQSDEGH